MRLPPSYAVRSLLARPARALLSAGVIALVIMACTLLLGLMSSLEATLVSSGDPLNLVVLRKGSDNDGSSQLSREAWQSIRYLDGIARDASGQPMVSPQLVVQPFLYRVGGGRENVLVRGLDAAALEVHPRVRIARGRMFRPSSGEVVVGESLIGRYEGAELGGTLRFGRGRWRVVGILEAGGSSFESEIWADASELARDARRPMPYSGVRVRASSEAALATLAARIADDPRFALEAKRETDYYADQAESSGTLFVLVVAIAVLAGLGAGFGAANTLYASVASRIAEIGTLRALGFPRGSILASFELEALLLGLAGFALGAPLSLGAAAFLGSALRGIAFGASTFTNNVVQLRVAPGDLAVALGLALAIGLLSGLGPAWRAARLRPVDALRRAGE
jgi:ABC-type antimicrobial peptide transport system permease subunit